MITIYQSTDTGFATLEQPLQPCWVDVTNPTGEEIRQVPATFNFPLGFMTTSLHRDEISHIEKVENVLLIVVRIPHFQGIDPAIPYVTRPLGIIVTPQWVVTVSRYEHRLLHDLHPDHAADLNTAAPTRFILHLLWSVANAYMGRVNDINETVEGLEEQLQRSLQNREVLELLRYQKSLVHFITALRANEMMLERLHRSAFLEISIQDSDLLDEVFTENRQAIAMSEIAGDILSQMMDAFASIISNNLNVVMKFMASITVILVIPSLVGTFYGMNVPLPLAATPSIFWILIGFSTLGSFLVGFIFRWKNWL